MCPASGVHSTINPNFAKTYTLTITTKPGGTVTQPGIGTFTFKKGTAVNLLALPQPLGYSFERWEGDKNTIADYHASSTTITMNGDYVINAKFKTVNVRTLTIISGAHGNVTQPGIGTFSYNEDTIVNLQAVPESGYHFVNWSGPVANPDAASTSITLTGNRTVTANFAPNGYTLTVICGSNGVVLGPGVGTFVFNPGTIVNLEVKENGGYKFSYWSGSTGTIEDPNATTTKIHMDGNYIITANFIRD